MAGSGVFNGDKRKHGENRERKGFLIGGVRLQWRVEVGGPAIPFLCHQGFKASWARWKQRGKTSWKRQIQHAASRIIIKQLLASIQPGQWMSLGKLCDNPMAYIDHPAIPIQPEGRLVSQGVKQGGLRSICKPESEGGGGLRLSRGRFFLISSVVGSFIPFRRASVHRRWVSLELTCIKREKQKDVTRERLEKRNLNIEGRDTKYRWNWYFLFDIWEESLINI